ncbi:fumarylacetoacetase [Comamonas sp. A7-5]|uniref:fumarylacetoacetase n=1 Tax=Comamonas sp. A7-5 TaxID=673549 RepID=UPI0031DF4F70
MIPGSETDATHDAGLTSFVASANEDGCDFPIQNLPFGRFRVEDEMDWRIGVAIGDQVLDVRRTELLQNRSMNQFMRLPRDARVAFRNALSEGLREGSPHRKRFESALIPMSEVQMGLPCDIGDYTDFYTSIHHASTVGRQFRPDQPLLPNYKWVPIAYHGRASSIVVSGEDICRPLGQVHAAGDQAPTLAPSQRLDYELELGVLISRPNVRGLPIPVAMAEDHVFGLALFNDWSARDIQAWEYQPLGPFLSKNFASTLAPWVVTLEALAPFRAPFRRDSEDPQPLPYLASESNTALGQGDIVLEVWLQTERMRKQGETGDCISVGNYKDAYWTMAQMIAHHTVGGCNLRAGDLLGTGTLSGPRPAEAGSLLELGQGGKKPIHLSSGESRLWLEDGDTVILRAYCEREGYRRIGFGECGGTIRPSKLGVISSS